MLYLALKRDLERISLARKHVLSHFELWDAVETIIFIKDAAEYRTGDLKGEIGMHPRYRFLTPKSPQPSANNRISMPKSSSKSSRRAWCVFLLPHSYTGFINLPQYQIIFESGLYFDGKRLRELPDPIPARDEIIPNPDSIPLSILIHPLGTKHEGPLTACEGGVPAPSSEDGPTTV